MSETNPYQTPGGAVSDVFNEEFSEIKILSFKGRLGRLRYFTYSFIFGIIFMFVAGIAMAIAIPMMTQTGETTNMTMMWVILLPIYIIAFTYMFMLGSQRLHDMNTTGWLSLLFLVPLANAIFALVLLFVPGTKGDNKYGLQTPPNSLAVKILASIAALLFVGYIVAMVAVAVPAYQDYVKRAQEASQGAQ